ncbi:oxidoreductase [Tenacibaculum finnmarkense]|uniref:WD40/YVTN/BNR-like repeat-containing protein n=1 Tax=Tenacibaculum finnmarkense TaxID=2781243 RepID=UPI00187BB9DF|nr:oxidoreductase [Tenacibaculum finnmarkense]MBE7659870.1 oxidoreductase [Tenacibaculum finnmarkense genomovar finnmarkense]MCG8251555.1 oxidoreductase [Tenacibaculum finnmarkense genomovar finnmarkense]MCG8815084.1 oxidoreductase [Tenacibaculum finnmarkense]MCG8820116.1 oxidoreductase [Tenacibaculum finnmarkense]MCG8893147.1 oxidoreductase [Tenacibaculum finnmarkense]
MNRFPILILVLFISFSCQKTSPKEVSPRKFKSIKISQFKQENTSIRALKIIHKNEIVFAGSNGIIGSTKNGGKSWYQTQMRYQDSIIPNFRSIAVTKNAVFALSVENPALLYKITADTTKIVYLEKHPKVFYNSLHFFDDKKHGIAVGDPTDKENCAAIILTSDGGNSWTKLPCSQLPTFEKGEAFYAASNTNISIVNNTVWIASGGTKARILKSTDFGNSWEIYNTPIVQGNGSQGIYSIDFYDENNGFIIGGNYTKPTNNCANKALTSDGGKTWKLVADNQNPTYKSCVQYVPNTNGKELFAVGITGVCFSNDAGNSWQKVSEEPYYSIQFFDKNTAWLSGDKKIGKLNLGEL